MTRIIAGEFGGRRIAVPAKGTRPTTDRVREALFSRLEHANAMRGAHVVDLYAGSGALGLETLSRGAAHVTFVEAAASAARTLQGNVRDLKVGSRATVVKEKVQGYLERAAPAQPWDLALLDPPYDIAPPVLGAALDALVPSLAPDALVIVEWSSRAPEPAWPDGITADRSKTYGETVLHYAERVG